MYYVALREQCERRRIGVLFAEVLDHEERQVPDRGNISR
jgi:hypothetical protein